MTESNGVSSVTLRDYWRVVWLRKWVVIGVLLVSAAVAFLLTYWQPEQYEATAQMMYVQPTDPSRPTTVSTIDINTLSILLQGVANTAESPSVKARVRDRLTKLVWDRPYDVTAKVTTPAGSSADAPVADIVAVTAKTDSPSAAASIANATALAIINQRKQSSKARLRAAEAVVRTQMDQYTTAESRQTADYVMLAQQLQNLRVAEATVTGDFTVVVPATNPASPVAPKPMQATAIGLAIGLVGGIAMAFVVGQFDTRVSDHREVSRVVGLPVLGRVPRVSQRALRNDPLLALTEPDGRLSEALRMLRSNLEWLSLDNPLRTIIVTSCLKGEGKSLVISNLAVTLARGGKRVLLVDADLRDPQLHRIFNLPNIVGATSVILETAKLADAAQTFRHSRRGLPSTGDGPFQKAQEASDESLRILTSGPLPPNPGEVVASRRFTEWLRELGSLDVDYVFIDTPPVLDLGDTAAMASSAQGLLLVVNVDVIRQPSLADGREVLEALPVRKLGVVVVGEELSWSKYNSHGKGERYPA